MGGGEKRGRKRRDRGGGGGVRGGDEPICTTAKSGLQYAVPFIIENHTL